MKNFELQKEVKSMQKIQMEQAKALEKITDENDYPMRIKAMVDELRCAKEHNKQLQTRLRQEEKVNKTQHEQLVRMEETIRELKGQGRKTQAITKDGNGGSEINKPYHVRIKIRFFKVFLSY